VALGVMAVVLDLLEVVVVPVVMVVLKQNHQ
jgi:hypothetical protein